ncbi:MAG: dihydrofolate reductase [Alteromonadaceae bacterium]|nr:MAG: dihydrofolate reductase [Alteromonadaceae bacterium]
MSIERDAGNLNGLGDASLRGAQVKVCIVVATAEDGAIGLKNTLPWRLSKDLQYFKKITLKHPIIMGRRTFDSIGRPLPGRSNIVVTRQAEWAFAGVNAVNSLSAALALATEDAKRQGLSEVMVIGGAQLYKEAIDQAQRIYHTEVHAEVEADAYFPAFDRQQWLEVSRERHEADEKNDHAFSFVVLDRVVSSSVSI